MDDGSLVHLSFWQSRCTFSIEARMMHVQAAHKSMTYFEFMADRVEAAKMVNPSQFGWEMFLTLAVLGPTYSALYTEIGIHPGDFLGSGLSARFKYSERCSRR
jgi:hypothetical protein